MGPCCSICVYSLLALLLVLSAALAPRVSENRPGGSSEPTGGGSPGRGVGDAQFGKKQVPYEVIER